MGLSIKYSLDTTVCGISVRDIAAAYFLYDGLKVIRTCYNTGLKQATPWGFLLHHMVSGSVLYRLKQPMFQPLLCRAYGWGEFSNVFLNIAGMHGLFTGSIPTWLLAVEIIGYGGARVFGIGKVMVDTWHLTSNPWLRGAPVVIYSMSLYWTGTLLKRLFCRL